VNNPNNRTTFIARLSADEAVARRVAALLAESLDPLAAAAALEQPDGRWLVEAHFPERPDLATLRDLVAAAAGPAAAAQVTVEELPARDWVKESLAGLRPVAAGRFVVHGRHDRALVRAPKIGVEIEASQAFGTGHHGTTRGCLLALDALSRRLRAPRRVLDLGTGSGVLAIAAAHEFRRPVIAVDIDPHAVRIARDNARLNRAGAYVTTVRAAGLNARAIASRAPFDLVFANILLGPLQRLAVPVARALAPGACVVLSGLLTSQANAALSAYRAQGLVLKRRIVLENWMTLVMMAPGA
jgi:ribosomal protein L11 methyltransferase